MPSPVPFAGVDRRTSCLRATLLISALLGLIACTNAWVNSHQFPLLPIVSWFPILPSPLDRLLFGTILLSLGAAFWYYRHAVIAFLALSFLAYCQDQNRGQPWTYMYWVMLLLTLCPAPSDVAACRIALSAAYVWSGIQKCNGGFFAAMPDYFVKGIAHWHLPVLLVDALRSAVAAAPLVELGIGLCLWLPRVRRLAIGAVVVLHLATLIFLGPAGYNYNWVVWPWNVAMIGLTVVLFTEDEFWQRAGALQRTATRESPRGRAKRIDFSPGTVLSRLFAARPAADFGTAFGRVRRSRTALAVVMLFSLLPALSFAGWWDSYFSFALYSGNAANGNLFLTKALADRLPAKIRSYVQPFPNYERRHQGPFLLAFNVWAYEELNVPPIPEPRNFRSIFNALRPYAREPGDVRLIIGPRAGEVIFYEGNRREFLAPKP